MSTEIDKVILELLKQEIRDEHTYNLAVQLYRAYREGGSKRVREVIYEILRRLGITITE